MKLADIKPGDAVLVVWQDAVASAGWQDLDDIDNEPATCRTVGFLLRRDRVALTLVTTTNDHGAATGTMTIPRKWIKPAECEILKRAAVDL